MKLAFVPSQNILLAQGMEKILLAGPFHSALDWVSPLWPGPHQGTPICCLCPLDGGFIVLTEHKCSQKYGFWKYMASISFRNSPNSGVICGTLVVLRIICPQEKPNRHALRTGDIGAHKFGFEGHNKIYLPPNSIPSGLVQVPDVTSSFWVTLLPWFSKCGPHEAALAPPGTC